ncbi:MAG: hypothetical protein MI923_24795 [Phycisphaerales bacterium]|nr:hypothetical protein [Phycisphaerales bacterium]
MCSLDCAGVPGQIERRTRRLDDDTQVIQGWLSARQDSMESVRAAG